MIDIGHVLFFAIILVILYVFFYDQLSPTGRKAKRLRSRAEWKDRNR